MSVSEDLRATILRILEGSDTGSDISTLKELISGAAASGDSAVAINGDAKGATITTGDGNRILNVVFQVDGISIDGEQHQGDGAKILRSLFQEILEPKVEIDWSQISRSLLEDQIQRLTSNPLTHAEGITYRTEQVYVPLGLVERKRQSRRGRDISPEQGSRLYKETEITQQFEHDIFLEQVLRQGHSPKSSGRRLAILGEPGAGKTTLLQQIARWVSVNINDSIVIWVSLADFRGELLEDFLLEGWLTAAARQAGKADASSLIKDTFVDQFQKDNIWLMLDGVDEMQISSGNALSKIEWQIRSGGLLSQARILLTCRLNLWDGQSHALDTFDIYRTLDFSYPEQVEQFIEQWFKHLPDAQAGQAENHCSELRAAGEERIRDLVKNPLRLTLLCFNWYLGNGELPETKARLYEQFVEDFYVWKQEQFPTTIEQRTQLNRALGELAREAIDKEDNRFQLRHDFICQFLGVPEEDGSLFQLALNLGWLNKIGVEENNRRQTVYAFFHPTFQEFFATLTINDWHFFLNHTPSNPLQPDSSYRIFEQTWREIFLLWLGSSYTPDTQKEELLNALMNFENRFGEHDFYGYRAKLLAASGLSEFQEFSKTQDIVDWILNLSIRQIATFNNPFANAARNLLKNMPEEILSDTLAMLLRAENSNLQHEAAKLAGEVKCSTPKVIDALTDLVLTTQFTDTRCDALCSLLEIDPANRIAIDGLIQTLPSRDMDAALAIPAAQVLRHAEVEQERVAQALEQCIQPYLLEENSILFPPQEDLICAAAFSLLKIHPENKSSIPVLQLLAQNHSFQIQRFQISKALERMGVENIGTEISTIPTNQEILEAAFIEKISALRDLVC